MWIRGSLVLCLPGVSDRRHGNQFAEASLRIGQVFLADLLSNRDDNALPAGTRSPQRDCDREFDPGGE